MKTILLAVLVYEVVARRLGKWSIIDAINKVIDKIIAKVKSWFVKS